MSAREFQALMDAEVAAAARAAAIFWAIYVFIAIVFALICAYYGNERGRSSGGWFLAGLFFGPLALFVLFTLNELEGGKKREGHSEPDGVIHLRRGDHRAWNPDHRTKTAVRLERMQRRKRL